MRGRPELAATPLHVARPTRRDEDDALQARRVCVHVYAMIPCVLALSCVTGDVCRGSNERVYSRIVVLSLIFNEFIALGWKTAQQRGRPARARA